MNFAKMIFAMMFFVIGILVGITEVSFLISPNSIQPTGDFNNHPIWIVHTTYLIFTISCLGSSFLLFKNFNKTEITLK